MDQPFYSNDQTENLLEWAKKLECLGNLITFLGETKDGEWALMYGDGALGRIVQDYAGALNQAIQTAYPEISKAFEESKKKKEKHHGD